ncbi:unnamed protein product [Rotaria socialis]|uniref:Uncharacterized protein n=1 Tax=Rotaria socialis TaxID=392032 RepID=A0A817XB32_9BILA|nr:unnamed protein product [Rotaria socialis]CAF4643128.1 unnamed protein product [Rotaria socialis]
MSTNNREAYRLSSKQRKHNTTVIPEIFEAPKILRKRKRRTNSSKLSNDDVIYQRFVGDLEKEIQAYVKQSLRESRFDTRANHCLETNASMTALLAALKSRHAPTTIGTYRSNETETVISCLSNRDEANSMIKQNERKRLEADVQKILSGPAMRNFYTHFIRPRRHDELSNPFEQLLLYVSEQ